MNKKVLAGVVVTAVAASSLFATQTLAQDEVQNGRVSLAQRFASNFNLDQAEVEQVVQAHQAERRANRDQAHADRLDQLVAEGKLTQEQKQALDARHQEMQAQRESHREEMQNLTLEERQALRQSRREEMEAWATEQGIDLSVLRPMQQEGQAHGGMGSGMGGRHMNRAK